MTNKLSLKKEIWPLLLVLLSCLASVYFYNNFPEQVATHWNFQGEVDGWSGRGFAAFFFPALIFGVYLMFLLIPKMDPRQEKYAQFARVYNIFKNILVTFLVAVYFLTSFSNLGYNLPVATYIPLGIGVLFVVMGNYFGKIKSNWFMGIRTPWTLSSETVWNKTHRFGGKVFILSGVIIAVMSWLPAAWRGPLFLAVVILMTFGTFGYSYVAYYQEKKGQKQK